MVRKCKNCGSVAQFKQLPICHLENDSLLLIYECGCGYKEERIYNLDSVYGRWGGTLIWTKKNEKKLRGK